jgi:hypothetical protein
MKIGIKQIVQLTVQALDHQATSLSQRFLNRANEEFPGEALYLQIHAEAEKSRAALRLLLRDALEPSDYGVHRASQAKTTPLHEMEDAAHAIHQAQAAIDRIVQQYLPRKIAA